MDVKIRKPIMIQLCEGNENYKYVRVAYAMGIPIFFATDMGEKEWEKYINGYYTRDQIDKYESSGSFW